MVYGARENISKVLEISSFDDSAGNDLEKTKIEIIIFWSAVL